MRDILNNASIVDVRTPSEYEEGHFEGAVNIPLNELSQRINEFKEMKKPIVTYCRSGARSGMAASILKQNGLNEVYNGGGLYDLLQLKNQVNVEFFKKAFYKIQFSNSAGNGERSSTRTKKKNK